MKRNIIIIILLALLGCSESVTTSPGLPSPGTTQQTKEQLSQPTGLTTISVSTDSVTVGWTAPASTGTGATIIGYSVRYGGEKNFLTNFYFGQITTTATRATITGLFSSTTYYYVVYVTNSTGNFAVSAPMSFRTFAIATPPESVTAISSTTSSLATTFSFTWTPPNNFGTKQDETPATSGGYGISYSHINGDYSNFITTTQTALTITNLSPLSTNQLIIYSSNSDGLSAKSKKWFFSTAASKSEPPKGAPQNLSATFLSNTSPTVGNYLFSWDAPTNTGLNHDGGVVLKSQLKYSIILRTRRFLHLPLGSEYGTTRFVTNVELPDKDSSIAFYLWALHEHSSYDGPTSKSLQIFGP